jgi:integrase
MAIIKFSHEINRQPAGWRAQYHYAVYEHRLIYDAARAYTRAFIVVKNQYDVIAHFTGLHKYVDAYAKGICVPMTSDGKTKMHYVCAMLNYILIENYEKFSIDHVFAIDKKMLEAFFQDFALAKRNGGGIKGRQAIERCVFAVTGFFRKLCRSYEGYMKISSKDLYNEKIVFSKRGRAQKKLTPNFMVRTTPTNKTTLRDIPTKVFQVIVNQAFSHSPEIVFAICLQAFAGLRPGEVCNVRQEGSPLGPGITITSISGVTKRVEIDLTARYALRSDGVRCGGIKRIRRQQVYPAFIPAFCKAYEHHKNLLRDNYEQNYAPMFVGRQGKAMTYHDYRSKFHALITSHVRTELLRSDDPECRLYGQLLYETKLSPHALRHWFSVQLALMGEDIAGMQFWRGDTSPESAFVYLQNKGDLIKELSAANEMLADFLSGEGGRLYGKQ